MIGKSKFPLRVGSGFHKRGVRTAFGEHRAGRLIEGVLVGDTLDASLTVVYFTEPGGLLFIWRHNERQRQEPTAKSFVILIVGTGSPQMPATMCLCSVRLALAMQSKDPRKHGGETQFDVDNSWQPGQPGQDQQNRNASLSSRNFASKKQ